jgi:ribosomal protein L16 Arg81 hydroxylase
MNTKSSSRPLDSKFWSDFAHRIWEKKPLVLRQIQTPLAEMDHTEVFRLLVLYANHCRKIRNPEGFKLFLDGQRVHEIETLSLLPRQSDKSLLGYHQRMNEMFEDYCLVCDELLQVNLKKQALLSAFTRELYRYVGFPNRFAEMGLYLGNYRKTPFGVHVDECGVFSFPVVGTKRFRLWKPSFVQKNPDLNRAFRYEKYKANSELLEARPGDMIYWPSSSWHIAESDGSFTATWSLGVWVNRPYREMVQQSVADLISSRLGAAGHSTMTPIQKLHAEDGEVHELPIIAQQSLAILQSLRAEDFKSALLQNWMVHISKEGFKTPPHMERQMKVTQKSVLQRGPPSLLWMRNKEDGTLLVSFAGTSVVFSKQITGVLKLIKALNKGEMCRVDRFLKSRAHQLSLQGLQRLADAGAFRSV